MFYNQIYQGGIRALLDYDNSIFDNFVAPADPDGVQIPAEDIIDHIIYKYGDAPLFTPDPAIMKFYIGKWSLRRLPLWERYYKAVLAEYEPLQNYDRTEQVTDELQHGHQITTDDDLQHGHRVTTDDDLLHGHSITTNDDLTNGLTTENQISADNANAYQPDSKSINSGKDERDISEVHAGSDQRDISEVHAGTDQRDISEVHAGKDTHTINSRVYGNIGVTTSQQMLESELNLIPRLDVIDVIADDFHEEFNLMIYN